MVPLDRPDPAGAAVPPWLDNITLRALETARERAFAWGRDALAAADAVRHLLVACRPSLPWTMIDEAVAAVVPDAEGLTCRLQRAAETDALSPATRQEIAEVLSYALRFNAEGKPRRTGHDLIAPLAAAQLVDQLLRSNMVVMRKPPAQPHRGW